MKSVFRFAFLLAVVGWAGLSLLPSAPGADKPGGARGRTAALTSADAEWVNKGDGKLTEAELIARLGPADELKSPGNAVADYAMVWRDRTMIRVKFDKDRAVEYTGCFSDRLPHKKVTRESFKKLKPGLSTSDVEDLLGVCDHETKEVQYWGATRTLTVYIKAGKVAGYGWGANNTSGWE